MKSDNSLEILKQAILLERKGQLFYAAASEASKNSDVREIFTIMAQEEELHSQYLVEQLKKFSDEGRFRFSYPADSAKYRIADRVIDKNLAGKISAISYEAMAISTAIDMENRAIEVYTTQAHATKDPHEKEFYLWLAEWESGHHSILFQLDKELREKIWFDSKFWEF
jgi:rubrerythrin